MNKLLYKMFSFLLLSVGILVTLDCTDKESLFVATAKPDWKFRVFAYDTTGVDTSITADIVKVLESRSIKKTFENSKTITFFAVVDSIPGIASIVWHFSNCYLQGRVVETDAYAFYSNSEEQQIMAECVITDCAGFTLQSIVSNYTTGNAFPVVKGYAKMDMKSKNNGIRIRLYTAASTSNCDTTAKYIDSAITDINGLYQFSNLPLNCNPACINPLVIIADIKKYDTSIISVGYPDCFTYSGGYDPYIISKNIILYSSINGIDTIVSVADSIQLSCVLSKTNDMASIGWSIDGGPFLQVSQPDTVVIAPSEPDSMYRCVRQVIYSDGTKILDTVNVRVISDPPEIIINAPDSLAVDSVCKISARQCTPGRFGKIISYEWKIPGNINFVKSIEPDTSFIMPDNNLVPVILRLTDDDNNQTTDTFTIKALRKWTVMGDSGSFFSKGEVGSGTFAFDSSNTPFIAYIDGYERCAVVMKWNGNKWAHVGQKGCGMDRGVIHRFTVSPDGTPWLYDGEKIARYTEGSGWEMVGALARNFYGSSSLETDRKGNTWFAGYQNDSLFLFKLIGSSWQLVSTKAMEYRMSYQGDYTPVIVFDNDDNPNFIYGIARDSVIVTRWSDGDWKFMTTPLCISVSPYAMTIDNSNSPCVVYSDRELESHRYSVKRFSNGQWQYLGNPGFAGTVYGEPGIKTLSDGSISVQAELSFFICQSDDWRNYSDYNTGSKGGIDHSGRLYRTLFGSVLIVEVKK